ARRRRLLFDTLFRGAMTCALVAMGTCIAYLFQEKLPGRAPLTLAFMLSVIISGSLLGSAWGWMAYCLSSLSLLAISAPAGVLRIDEHDVPRLIIFMASGAVMMYLIGCLHRVNRSALKAKAEAESARHGLQFLATVSSALAIAPN